MRVCLRACVCVLRGENIPTNLVLFLCVYVCVLGKKKAWVQCAGSKRLLYSSIDACSLPAASIAISRRHFKCCGEGLELLICVYVRKRRRERVRERETERGGGVEGKRE